MQTVVRTGQLFVRRPAAPKRRPTRRRIVERSDRSLHRVTRSPSTWCRAVREVDSGRPFSPCDVDRDLWEVLELCNREELELLYDTLFAPSLFSPFVKSLVVEKEPAAVEYRGRTAVMHKIQSRFRFLAASSMQTLQGYRPTYRETLMHIQSRCDHAADDVTGV